MENLYLILSIAAVIVSIIAIIKFFQMASDVRALKQHFVKEETSIPIGFNEEVHGTIRGRDITYVVMNGSTKFSDGKVGYIKYMPNGKYTVPTIRDKVFGDIYYAAEALYESLKQKE